jgi:2-C-methyl-D-erythritol 4-phosphate cytidylyltransferase
VAERPRGNPSSRLALIIPAAGDSTRIGGEVRKPFIELRGLPLVCHTLRRFQGLAGLEQVVIVAPPDALARVRAAYWPALREHGATHLVAGGARRQDSVAKGLGALGDAIDLVLVHDAVRPFVSPEAVAAAVGAAAEHGAAVVAVPVPDTLKRAVGEVTRETVPRGDLWAAQTPQVFQFPLLRQAFDVAARDGFESTDDAQLVERLGTPVRLVPGGHENFKITTPDHLRMAEALLARPEYR